jgi:hypothetical protein
VGGLVARSEQRTFLGLATVTMAPSVLFTRTGKAPFLSLSIGTHFLFVKISLPFFDGKKKKRRRRRKKEEDK